MTQKNHIHKFKRDTYSTGKKFYYCIQPDCNFKIECKHALGKISLCHVCNQSFQMNEYSIRKAKPKCNNCINRKTLGDMSHAHIVDDRRISDRRKDSSASPIPEVQNSITKLQEKLHNSSVSSNLEVKEYTPEDE